MEYFKYYFLLQRLIHSFFQELHLQERKRRLPEPYNMTPWTTQLDPQEYGVHMLPCLLQTSLVQNACLDVIIPSDSIVFVIYGKESPLMRSIN